MTIQEKINELYNVLPMFKNRGVNRWENDSRKVSVYRYQINEEGCKVTECMASTVCLFDNMTIRAVIDNRGCVNLYQVYNPCEGIGEDYFFYEFQEDEELAKKEVYDYIRKKKDIWSKKLGICNQIVTANKMEMVASR